MIMYYCSRIPLIDAFDLAEILRERGASTPELTVEYLRTKYKHIEQHTLRQYEHTFAVTLTRVP